MVYAIITVLFISGEPPKRYSVESEFCFDINQMIAETILSELPTASSVTVKCEILE